MRPRISLLLAILVTASLAHPAAAWDPEGGDGDVAPSFEAEPPAADPAEPADPSGSGEPAPSGGDLFVVPDGLYSVTDVYAGDVVRHDGALTTYETATVHESPGTYARPVDTVGSGDASRFDGASFNGRTTLSDGRPVAGTYYETFIKTDGGYVSVSIVFFQDDAELAKQRAGGGSGTPPAEPATAAPGGAAPAPAEPPSGPGLEPPTAPAAGDTRDRPDPPSGRRIPDAPPVLPGRGTVTLRPVGVPIAELEVLRGRTVALWLHAYAGEVELPVRSWSLVAGDPGEPVALSGTGVEPFVTSWDRLSPPGESRTLRFSLVAGGALSSSPLSAVVRVVVRSPALTA
jgi:hypothetical protein